LSALRTCFKGLNIWQQETFPRPIPAQNNT
jgi:hypothetical protein